MIWKPVCGLEKLYEVSERGDVRGLDRDIKVSDSIGRAYTKTLKGSRRIAQRKHEFGYWMVTLSEHGKTYDRLIHRLVAEAFIGSRPKGMVIRHLDGDCENNHYTNLAYGTQLENMKDAADHGTIQIGEERYNAILTEEIIEEIRNKKAAGARGCDLSKEYGLSDVYIHHIVTGKKWRHAPGPITKGRTNKILTDEERKQVAADHKSGMTKKALTEKYKVSMTQIRNSISQFGDAA